MKRIRLLIAALAALGLLAAPSGALAKPKDRDHDRMPDRWERANHLNPRAKDAKADPDRDGLSNLSEFRSRTDPHDVDTDDDGVSDGQEDADRDGVDNANEAEERTNPRDADTDDDGVRDGREDADRDGLRNAGEDRTGNDPVDPDTDDDGVKDGRETAGSIASLAGDMLTIALPNGQPFTARVTSSTEVECKTEAEHEDENEARDEESHHGVRAASHGDDDSPQAGTTPAGAGDDEAEEEHELEQEREGDADNVCSLADLTANVVVHEAEVSLTSDGPVFTKLEILK
jgi:hypothetical protein